MYREAVGWAFTALLVSSSLVGTFSYPNVQINSRPVSSDAAASPSEPRNFYPVKGPRDVPQFQRAERKFAEKPNAIKKVALDRLDDVESNSIAESSDNGLASGGGFSWSNLLAPENYIGMLMQMIFNPGGNQGPNKSDDLDTAPVPTSPWANLLSVGLKILTAILGGGNTGGDGIDKVDNGNSPMQGVLAAVVEAVVGDRDPEQVNKIARQAGEFINIVVNLLDALKTSFSHRSLQARSLGKKDSVSDAAVASLSMMKGYMRSLSTGDTKCMERYVCQANSECSKNVGQSSLYCHLGSYAISYVMEKSLGSSFDVFYEAGRRGRYGDNCQEKYLECNEV
ncbi:uncharacterized protein LOC114331353 isoform X1 [Diabrotica virgifera virgifera]|uniref:Uncharacterized protein LOC114331353 isoform X1 n=1 Tax=Diabrotica virgifera virgifera TaxID=50390 RepID=A0A6P7FUU1_DIAVI|nr:uncharacterized protein LOC114331353 isoform X1 [Diabrotica virgifera virgifera]